MSISRSARAAVIVTAGLTLAACRSQAPSPPAVEPAAAASPAVAPPVPAAEGSSTYVSSIALLRREPSEAKKVAGPGNKEVSNVLTMLQRGERVTVAADEVRRVNDEEWVKVRSSDDREGWIKRSSLLEGEGIVEATVLVAADVFDRPDLLAANTARKLEPASLLLVVRTRAAFSEVNVGAGPNAWVLTERLATGPADVGVAKLAEKARWLRRSGKPEEASKVLALARTQFPGNPLLDQVAIQLGEAPPADGAVVPASGTLPAPGQPGEQKPGEP